MAQTFSGIQVALALLSFTAVVLLHILGFCNGMIPMLQDNITSSQPVLPGSTTPLRTRWTGLGLVDLDLSIMVSVFSTILDARNLSLFIQGSHFFGLWMASWLLILLESHRTWPVAKSWRKYTYVLWGLAMEFAGVSVGLPLWCATALHRVQTNGTRVRPSVPMLDQIMLPWSFMLSAIIPALPMVIGKIRPDDILFSRQTWILIRLFHPLLLVAIHNTLCSTNRVQKCLKIEAGTKNMKAIYFVAFWSAAVPHILTGLAVIPAQLIPQLLPAKWVSSFALSSLWPVKSLWQGFWTKKNTIPLGISAFMTANEIISTAAILLWAWSMKREATNQLSNFAGPRLGLVQTLSIAFIFGPGAAAVAMIQEADAVVQAGTNYRVHKKES